jgi:hypothetical protein
MRVRKLTKPIGRIFRKKTTTKPVKKPTTATKPGKVRKLLNAIREKTVSRKKKPSTMSEEGYKKLSEAIQKTQKARADAIQKTLKARDKAIKKKQNVIKRQLETEISRYASREPTILRRTTGTGDYRYYDISKLKEYKLHKNAIQQKGSKLVRAHTTAGPLKGIPNPGNIAVLFFEYLKYDKNFSAISVLDRDSGHEAGRVGIMFTKKTAKYLNKFKSKAKNMTQLRSMIYEDVMKVERNAEIKAEIKARSRFKKSKLSNQDPIIDEKYINTLNERYRDYFDSQKIEVRNTLLDYYQKIGLKFRFIPNAKKGYRFNKETLTFENPRLKGGKSLVSLEISD